MLIADHAIAYLPVVVAAEVSFVLNLHVTLILVLHVLFALLVRRRWFYRSACKSTAAARAHAELQRRQACPCPSPSHRERITYVIYRRATHS